MFPAEAYDRNRVEIPLGERVSDGFDWQNLGPLDLLEKLKRGYVEGVQFPCFTAWGVHRGWIRESDIPGLFELAGSTEPCLAVVMSTCSFLPMEPSTVGQEALSMVLAFLEEEAGLGYGGYPARLNSTSHTLDVDELVKRWRDRPSEDHSVG